MRVKISQLGPIKEANIKINDLTILIGDNNAGKTYITYSVFGLLNYFNSPPEPYFERFLYGSAEKSLFQNKEGKSIVRIPLDSLKGIFDRSNKEVGGKRYNDFLKLLFNDKGEDLISQKSLIEPVFDPEDIQFETHSKDKNKLFKELSYEVIGEELVIQFETTENYPTEMAERELFFSSCRENWI